MKMKPVQAAYEFTGNANIFSERGGLIVSEKRYWDIKINSVPEPISEKSYAFLLWLASPWRWKRLELMQKERINDGDECAKSTVYE